MKVFLSHARKDDALARQLAERLTRAGFTVWLSDDQMSPLGENWAKKMGKALDESELMVILLTPAALASDSLRRDIDYALGSKKYAGRFFTVFVGSSLKGRKDVPWILRRLPHREVESAKDFGQVAKEIQSLCEESALSHSHA